MAYKILVVEDELPIADILKFNLEREGYLVANAYDGEEALQMTFSEKPDLVLLDVMIPKKDGFQVLKEIRDRSQLPVLMVTAKEEEVDKVLGLELGADDYITKPFSIRELLARVKANLRRMGVEEIQENPEDKKVLRFSDLEINLTKYEVKKRGQVIELTLREFELLQFLAAKPDQVFSREQLLEEVWGYEYYGDIRTVDVTVRRLRVKVEDDSSKPKFIYTKRGVGYYFKRS
ncbi:response regulator YycF [Gottschalkiaceae bacterium SANA]|nr:response regulator YycF [Gottschalkiaceae bacterium SANA]